MNDSRNLNAMSHYESTVSTDVQALKSSRRPWHTPVLRRSDVTLYTGHKFAGPHKDGATSNGTPLVS